MQFLGVPWNCEEVYVGDFTDALCFLQGIASEIPPSPETLVGWLLEHPDHALCNSDTASSFDGLSDTDSISEEVEDVTVSHTEGVIVVLNADLITSSYHRPESGHL
jgi:hypothetical protein